MPIKTNLDNSDVPVLSQVFKLPSCGYPYGEGFPKEVEVQPYSFDTEAILASSIKRPIHKLVKIAEAVTRNFPDTFNYNKLLLGDLFVIIALARSLTYDSNYQFPLTCPACGHHEIASIKVPDELPVKTWEEYKNLEELNRDGLTVKLPRCGDVINFQYLGAIEEMEAYQHAKDRKEELGDLGWVAEVACQIVSVNNTKPDDIKEAVEYLKRVNGPDMVALQDKISDSRIGVEIKYKVCCDECQFEYDVEIPLESDFFRRNRV